MQEYNLDPSIVNATKEDMQKLVEAGEDLLEQPVKIQNVTSFVPYEKPSEGTNAQALERFVQILTFYMYSFASLDMKKYSMFFNQISLMAKISPLRLVFTIFEISFFM